MVQDGLTLCGKTVALTRSRDQAQQTGELVKKYGGKPYFIPSIQIGSASDLSAVKHFADLLEHGKVDIVVFMSENGIHYLLSSTMKLGLSDRIIKCLNDVVVLAVGPKTAGALEKQGIGVSLVPVVYSSTGVLDCLKQYGIEGKSVFIPRTKSASAVLIDRLRDLGATVEEVYVYESLLVHNPELAKKFIEDLAAHRVDAIVFGSSLSARNLFEMLEQHVSSEELVNLLNSLTVVAIGPVTAQTLNEFGVHVDVMPSAFIFEAALVALARFWSS